MSRWTEEELAIHLGKKTQETSEMSESELMWKVRRLAQESGWLEYHTHDSRRSPAGFPDLVFARAGRIVFAELKKESEKPTKEQDNWLDTLRLNPSIEVYVWRPSDWLSGEIRTILIKVYAPPAGL